MKVEGICDRIDLWADLLPFGFAFIIVVALALGPVHNSRRLQEAIGSRFVHEQLLFSAS